MVELEVVGGGKALLWQLCMVELGVEVDGKASLEDLEGRLEHVCDGGEVHWR